MYVKKSNINTTFQSKLMNLKHLIAYNFKHKIIYSVCYTKNCIKIFIQLWFICYQFDDTSRVLDYFILGFDYNFHKQKRLTRNIIFVIDIFVLHSFSKKSFEAA